MNEYIATLGPACARAETLAAMLENGMTALRLNLSHGGLDAHPDWLAAFSESRRMTGRACGLILDLQGPELRCGNPAPLTLEEGAAVDPERDLRLPAPLLAVLRPGLALLLDDGRLRLSVTPTHACAVERGGLLPPGKSVAAEGLELPLPALTAADLLNLRQAPARGVTAVLLSFTRGAQDVLQTRAALARAGAPQVKIIAKIENEDGVKQISLIAKEADAVCIARGDLGNRLPLWELPALQLRLGAACRAAGTPFYVATQLLASLEQNPTPTRAEMNDIFHSALAGASGFILTGETAIGADPANAVRYLRLAAEAARQYQTGEC